MKPISSVEIRNKFLSFFKENDHMEITDSSIVPKNDPTLLFVNSGMAPIKNYFTGVEKPPYPRLCDVQPCIRTIDIDSVGDKHHLTSFQMLGSWSINDYFKEKAIALAFKFLTESLNIPKEKLYVTVFSGDEELGLPLDSEAYEYWKKIGVPDDHIIKCGKEDNFWGPTAETGPCGPCTEIFYDTGEGEKYVPGGEFDTKKRYIEIWNAGVFMQLNKNSDGTFSNLSFTSVDTGAGLERLAMVLGGFSCVYDTDLLSPIKDFIQDKMPQSSQLSQKDILIMTDHLRTTALILSEKVSPSNEGRGYIPRKLIRRCMMMVSRSNAQRLNLFDVVEFIIDKYSDIFKKFKENREYILKEFEKEQNQFKKVLQKGLERLESIKSQSIKIDSSEAFDLVTTYGLPFDIIKTYAQDNAMNVDEAGFKAKLEAHKEKSKSNVGEKKNSGFKAPEAMFTNCEPTNFVGYERTTCSSNVIKIIKESEIRSCAVEGETVWIVLDKSPFYAECGGQCADEGYLENEKCKVKISNVQKTSSGVFVHLGTVKSGTLHACECVESKINEDMRLDIANNHTAVHLLQSALRKIFGKNVHQEGSRVERGRLRFDFNYDGAITSKEIFEIEKTVNGYIRENILRKVEIKKLSDAIASGATALFESKYGETVRVVSYGDVSLELCGGTHTERTGNIGLFTIVCAEGIGKGIRRITALTSNAAVEYLQKKVEDLNKLAKIVKANPETAVEKAENMLSKESTANLNNDEINESDITYVDIKSGVKLGYVSLNCAGKKFSSIVSHISDKTSSIIVGIVGKEKKQIVIAVGEKLMGSYEANALLTSLLKKIGGKGGGNKKVATGGASVDSKFVIEEINKILL